MVRALFDFVDKQVTLGNVELETCRRNVKEARGKLEEAQIQKTDVSSAIERTERLIHVQNNSTGAEVFRLRGKLVYLEKFA